MVVLSFLAGRRRVVASLAGLLALAGTARAQTPDFTLAGTPATGAAASRCVAIGDVNGDGQPDALVGSQSGSRVTVMLGDGTGGFAPAGQVAVTSPSSLALADVNGDTKLDALVGNSSAATLSVLLGNGAGGFTLQTGPFVPVSTGGANTTPVGVVMGDVSGDGKPDAVLANSGIAGSTLAVLVGDGAGNFYAATSPSTGAGSRPQAVVLADVNNDGRLDALTANNNTNTLGVLLNDQYRTLVLTSSPSTGTGSRPQGVAVADVNNDGKLDALTANNATGTLGVLLGDGAGGFTLQANPASVGGTARPTNLVIADVNVDGKPDAVLTTTSSAVLSVLLGDGSGGFALAVQPATGGDSTPGLAVADLNNDGKPDVLAANNGGSTLGVLLNTTTLPDLVVDAPGQTIAPGGYNTIGVNAGGTATLGGLVGVARSLSVASGATLYDGCSVLSGAGSFTLAAGATLGICHAQGISSSGATGAIQTTGPRAFASDARYLYNGAVAQATGTGLPATVHTLTLANAAGLTLTSDLATTTAATLSTGPLSTGANALTLGSAATLTETTTGYARGTVQATRLLATAGSSERFGGLGLTLLPSGSTLPGSTLVVRTTGTARPGVGSSQSVRRVFDIRPTVTAGLNVALTLAVRDDERNTIAPANLRLFKSADNGSTWQAQAGVSYGTATANGVPQYTATLSGIRSFSLWTLGDAANPLPVQLVSFTAQRQGPVVALAWRTASEAGSARFEVQRSPDGAAWATVGTVAAAGSSATTRQYEWLDAGLPAGAGPRYYRLRAVDLDGSSTYSAVQLVAGPEAGLTLSPNPAAGCRATLGGAAAGAEVRVYNVVGELVLTATADAAGTAALVWPAGLPGGLYLVRCGAAPTLRLVVE